MGTVLNAIRVSATEGDTVSRGVGAAAESGDPMFLSTGGSGIAATKRH